LTEIFCADNKPGT